MDDNCLLVQQLNDNNSSDLSKLNLFPDSNDTDDNPYLNVNIDSNFYDYNSFKYSYANSKQPIILNINIQSFKKYGKFRTQMISTYQDLILHINNVKRAGVVE